MDFNEFKEQYKKCFKNLEREGIELDDKISKIIVEVKRIRTIIQKFGLFLEERKRHEADEILRKNGFTNENSLIERLEQLESDCNNSFKHLEQVHDALNRKFIRCRECGGFGQIKIPVWVDGDLGRRKYFRFRECALCNGRGLFLTKELLDC